MAEKYLAQLNIARLAAPLESPQLKDFVGNLESINQLAEASPGFIWRLQTVDGDATSIDYFGSEYIVNMSVWKDADSLHDFVYRSAHAPIMARRKEWFERMSEAYQVLWWIPAGHEPSLEEADERLTHLREKGPTDFAFTFKKQFPA